jgi:RHS repeat-associated protein
MTGENSSTTRSAVCTSVVSFTASRCTGKERDTESGNDYFEARYYGSSSGRFMSPDPLGGHQEDPQTLNKYSYVRNNPLNLTDPTGLDWYLGCTSSDHAGCTQLRDKDKTWVQAGKNGNATVVTSDSIRNGNNSATVDQNGVHITTGGGTYQGVYYDNPASKTFDSNGKVVDDRNPLTVQGDASKGLGGFTFDLNGNCGNTCLASGSFRFAGTPEQAEATLRAAGSWDYGIWDMFNSTPYGNHPYSQQFRFGSGPSSHFSVPDYVIPSPQFGVPAVLNPEYTVPATGGFHVDAQTGKAHGLCANLNIGCGK